MKNRIIIIIGIIFVGAISAFALISNSSNKFENSEVEIQVLDENNSLKAFSGVVSENNNEGINGVNFYFENSGSMNGYLNETNFRQTMQRILGGRISNYPLNSYFVNTQEYPTTNILSKIENDNILTPGIENSDHSFIFTNAINAATNNNLSIVVTDGIYSVGGEGVDLVGIQIEQAFVRELENNKVETVILKLTSNYQGQYYFEDCPGSSQQAIDHDRPYYILLFGNTRVIDDALAEIVIPENLAGFDNNNQARFFISDNMDYRYSILTSGEEKHGDFMSVDKFEPICHEIEDAEKFSRGLFSSTPPDESYLGFGIAVDFSKIKLPESYKEDTANYSVGSNTAYDLVEVKKVSNLNTNTGSYRAITRLKESEDSLNPTHILVLKGRTNLYGKVEISLNNNLPYWIKQTGIEEDCDISSNNEQTFAFDQLMNGISQAYKKVNNKEEYLNISINIKT